MTDGPRFAHASEAELARILDYYGVRWQYEPHTFPIQWNLDGVVVESFAPDFYLPDLELYVELTTLKQSLVRRKNRKLRRVRELYPDVRIKLFYGKDFKALMLKYGRLEVAASLSGLEGQELAAARTAGIVPAPLPPEPSLPPPPALAVGGGPATALAAAADALADELTGRRSRGSRRRRARRRHAAASGA